MTSEQGNKRPRESGEVSSVSKAPKFIDCTQSYNRHEGGGLSWKPRRKYAGERKSLRLAGEEPEKKFSEGLSEDFQEPAYGFEDDKKSGMRGNWFGEESEIENREREGYWESYEGMQGNGIRGGWGMRGNWIGGERGMRGNWIGGGSGIENREREGYWESYEGMQGNGIRGGWGMRGNWIGGESGMRGNWIGGGRGIENRGGEGYRESNEGMQGNGIRGESGMIEKWIGGESGMIEKWIEEESGMIEKWIGGECGGESLLGETEEVYADFPDMSAETIHGILRVMDVSLKEKEKYLEKRLTFYGMQRKQVKTVWDVLVSKLKPPTFKTALDYIKILLTKIVLTDPRVDGIPDGGPPVLNCVRERENVHISIRVKEVQRWVAQKSLLERAPYQARHVENRKNWRLRKFDYYKDHPEEFEEQSDLPELENY